MKNITRILALSVIFAGLSANSEVDLKDNNVPEATKATHSEKVLKFAKDHKKKLIAGTAFAIWCGIGFYRGRKCKKVRIRGSYQSVFAQISLSERILNSPLTTFKTIQNSLLN